MCGVSGGGVVVGIFGVTGGCQICLPENRITLHQQDPTGFLVAHQVPSRVFLAAFLHMKKKCKQHYCCADAALSFDAPIDTDFYEIGQESECVVCIAEAQRIEKRRQDLKDNFDEALTTWLMSEDVGGERKKAAIDMFLPQ